MNSGMILDCTLRDGAYLIDKKFGDENINGIIAGLVEANIDIIEIGFLQNEGMEPGKTIYFNSKDAEKFIPQDRGNSMFAVLADYSRYSVDNLDDYTGKSFDIVRACFFKHEKEAAMDFCREVKRKGYKVFVQPVDILGYSDAELIELIASVNCIEPYCLSIVDTFGSMYAGDLRRVFSIIDHNLIDTCRIGFHSHNNMQMSNALSQEFLSGLGSRYGVIDTTLSGMGRGAGNTPTELVAQYMTAKLGYHYNIDVILDVINNYIDHIRAKCTWGYSTDLFIAGCYSSHVNNIDYLRKKTGIRAKDIRYIINKLSPKARKRYDYDLLENIYMEYISSDIDDKEQVSALAERLSGRNIVVLCPGKSLEKNADRINDYIRENNAVVINVNFITDSIPCDYLYCSNVKRFETLKRNDRINDIGLILASNINYTRPERCFVVSYPRLVKCGWINLDNSVMMLLRLIDDIDISSIAIAGFDGYDTSNKHDNYVSDWLESAVSSEDLIELNSEIKSMFDDYVSVRKHKDTEIVFLTESRFNTLKSEEK